MTWNKNIDDAPRDGGFLAWCRWQMKPYNTSTGAVPYKTDWMARHVYRSTQGRLQGEGNSLYYVDGVEATHWMPLPLPPEVEG